MSTSTTPEHQDDIQQKDAWKNFLLHSQQESRQESQEGTQKDASAQDAARDVPAARAQDTSSALSGDATRDTIKDAPGDEQERCGEDQPVKETEASADPANPVGQAAQAGQEPVPVPSAPPQGRTHPETPSDNPWDDIAAQAARNASAEEPAGKPAPAPLPADAGGSGALPPERTAAAGEDDMPALPEEEEQTEEEGEGGRMSLMDHLRELRTRILYSLAAVFVAFLACWAVVEPVFNILTKPLLDVLPAGSTAMYTTLPEAFFTRMYIAFIVGLFVASPFIFYQIWSFISPGLYEEEKHFILPIAFISALFFIAGGLFCYYIVFKYAFAFFVSFATEDIVAMPKISDYLDFVLKLVLAFGFIFEMPIFAFFLSRMGIVTAKKMRSARRYAVLVIFIVAAILTPPDVVSQLLMAVPMLVLYEVSILVAALFGKKVEEKPQEEEEAEDADYDEEYADDADDRDDTDWADDAEPVKRQETAAAAATPSAAPSAARPATSVTRQEQGSGSEASGQPETAGSRATGLDAASPKPLAGQDGEQVPTQKP